MCIIALPPTPRCVVFLQALRVQTPDGQGVGLLFSNYRKKKARHASAAAQPRQRRRARRRVSGLRKRLAGRAGGLQLVRRVFGFHGIQRRSRRRGSAVGSFPFFHKPFLPPTRFVRRTHL